MNITTHILNIVAFQNIIPSVEWTVDVMPGKEIETDDVGSEDGYYEDDYLPRFVKNGCFNHQLFIKL